MPRSRCALATHERNVAGRCGAARTAHAAGLAEIDAAPERAAASDQPRPAAAFLDALSGFFDRTYSLPTPLRLYAVRVAALVTTT